ncbi:SMC-Scp complex subunit ScpB, partial [Mycobacterium sp. ITM-2017-0098]
MREEHVPDERTELDEFTAPELDDAELDSVLEALLLVVDTPVTVDALASATDQTPGRVA